jgi:protein-tyrosine phosphatase
VIDTHCHLLHGLDDGPRVVGDSIDMARTLAGAGVTGVACTPHFSGRFLTPVDDARAALDELRIALAAESVELEIVLGAELSPAMALDAPDRELLDRTLGAGSLLVELEPDTPVAAVDLVIARLGDLGLRAVFAHPERCRAVRSRPRVLDAARSAGALVQVVVRSLGRPTRADAGAAWDLLDAGRVDLIASDAHRAADGAALGSALEEVGRRYGGAALAALIDSAPARLLGRPEVADEG